MAKNAGFCFGVRRAMDIAFKIANEKKVGVFTLGPIIHNPQVIGKLKDMGVAPVDGVEELKGKDASAVIIRTHGVPHSVTEDLERAGIEVVDATCPYVKKAQHYAKLLKDEGYQVLILGDKEHPEVKGLMSYAGDGTIVVKDSTELPALKKKVGIVVQTTRHVNDLKALLDALLSKVIELKVFNTICSSTTRRLSETEDMAAKMGVMVIVGGKNSANTTRLATLCESLSVPTHHIETSSELRAEWFEGVQDVGISAGASTPDWIIQDVKESIINIGGSVVDGT